MLGTKEDPLENNDIVEDKRAYWRMTSVLRTKEDPLEDNDIVEDKRAY